MRLTSLLIVPVAAAALGFVAGPASAGEINGNGLPVGGKGLGASHASSICAFSGLEDGDGAGFPGPGGAPPQNWGHVKQSLRAEGVPAAAIAATRPGVTCNGHSGILAGGGEEPPA
jgi:hypothetical protein